MKLENPVPLSGLFTVDVLVMDAELTRTFMEKLGKQIGVKDLKALKVYRYEDPVMGPRTLPQFDNYEAGKVLLEEGQFIVDVEKKQLSLVVAAAGRTINIGTNMCYVVE